MAYQPLVILPGVFTDITEFAAEGRYRRSNRIRCCDCLAEPIHGWQKMLREAMTGIPGALLAWAELDDTRDIAVGTDPFPTTNGSAVVSAGASPSTALTR